MTLAEKYGPPLFPAKPDGSEGRLRRLDSYLATGIPTTARDRRIKSALRIHPEPLDALCLPPATPEKIAAIRAIQYALGEAFATPHLQHHFGMSKHFKELLACPEYYNRNEV